MKRRVLFLLFFVPALGCVACTSFAARPTATPTLIGTWRVVRFCNVDSTTGDSYPLGDHPRGIFVYSPNGQLSLQAMLAPGDSASRNSSPVGSLANYFGYFGTYTITSDTTVVHRVTGGTIPDYIGTDQPRRYKIWGPTSDSLTIGGGPAWIIAVC